MSKKCEVVARRKSKDEFEIFIHVPLSKLKKSPDGTRYFFLDVEQSMPKTKLIGGIGLVPRLIAKLYVRVPPKTAKRLRLQQSLKSARNGEPIML